MLAAELGQHQSIPPIRKMLAYPESSSFCECSFNVSCFAVIFTFIVDLCVLYISRLFLQIGMFAATSPPYWNSLGDLAFISPQYSMFAAASFLVTSACSSRPLVHTGLFAATSHLHWRIHRGLTSVLHVGLLSFIVVATSPSYWLFHRNFVFILEHIRCDLAFILTYFLQSCFISSCSLLPYVHIGVFVATSRSHWLVPCDFTFISACFPPPRSGKHLMQRK